MALLAALNGCGLLPSQPRAPLRQAGAATTVFIDSRGYHTDIALRTADLTGPLAAVAHDFPGARSLLVGFGDRTFVTTRRKWLGTWLLTLLPGRGAMLVTGLRGEPDQAFAPAHIVALRVSAAQFAGIQGFIADSFEQPWGRPVFIGLGPYPGSRFYAARRIYSLLYTCNTWSAAALRSGGLPEPVFLTLFAPQAMQGARRLQATGY